MAAQVGVARPSLGSLLIEMRKHGASVGTATAFIVERTAKRYLVTNRHVVRGERQTALPLLPDELVVVQHISGQLGQWTPRIEQLYEQAQPRWYEHPNRAPEIDVAVLPL